MQSLNVNVKPKLIITISMYIKLFFLILKRNIQLIASSTFEQQHAPACADTDLLGWDFLREPGS